MGDAQRKVALFNICFPPVLCKLNQSLGGRELNYTYKPMYAGKIAVQVSKIPYLHVYVPSRGIFGKLGIFYERS